MGSMHGPVTYTRPLPITGGAIGENVETILTGMDVEEGDYHGPTTIVFLVTQQAPELGIETMWLIVSLPSYFSLETDYIGKIRLMEILNYLYGISIFEADKKKAEEQLEYIKRIIKQYPQLQDLVAELETHYDAQKKKEKVQLPPEIEKMLEEIEKKGFPSQN